MQVKPEPQDTAAPMETASYGTSPPDTNVVKAEPPNHPAPDPSANPASLHPSGASQHVGAAGGEGPTEGEGVTAMGVKAEPSQESLVAEASLQVRSPPPPGQARPHQCI